MSAGMGGVGAQLPKWKSHKEVWADRIIAMDASGWYLACGDHICPDVTAELTKRGEPQPGDYFVQYDDGYKSWSPAGPFEEGYTKL
jgi:hypothetical protein